MILVLVSSPYDLTTPYDKAHTFLIPSLGLHWRNGFFHTSLKFFRTSLSSPRTVLEYTDLCSGIPDSYLSHWYAQESIPLFDSMQHMMLSHLLMMLMGERFYGRHQVELVDSMLKFQLSLLHPSLRILPWRLWRLSSTGRFISNVFDRFDELVSAEALDIVNNPDEHSGRADYFYKLVSKFGTEYLRAYGTQVVGMIFAGNLNMALTLPWLLLHARNTPGALERLQAEATISASNRRYTDACIRETSRLYTNTLISRVTRGPVELAGHALPSGTTVACSPLAWQTLDETEGGVFAEAERWIPERFLAEGKYSEWFQKAYFVQYGLGPHACPGERLARGVMLEVLKAWLEKYDFEVVGGSQSGRGIDGVGVEPAWDENVGTPGARGDVLVKLTKRVL